MFRSAQRGIAPLIEYLAQSTERGTGVRVYDRVIGNAAALLAIKAHAVHVMAVTGSRYAVDTFQRYGIHYEFRHIVSSIINRSKDGMCPYESLSLGMTPNEFYEAAYAKIITDGIVTGHRQ